MAAAHHAHQARLAAGKPVLKRPTSAQRFADLSKPVTRRRQKRSMTLHLSLKSNPCNVTTNHCPSACLAWNRQYTANLNFANTAYTQVLQRRAKTSRPNKAKRDVCKGWQCMCSAMRCRRGAPCHNRCMPVGQLLLHTLCTCSCISSQSAQEPSDRRRTRNQQAPNTSCNADRHFHRLPARFRSNPGKS